MVVKRLPDSELYHHGVKGQRWGVRNYQNADGSLTARGRQKYTTGKSKGVKRRGEGLGTGPVGRSDAYIGRKLQTQSRIDSPEFKKMMLKNRYKSLGSVDSFKIGYDKKLKDNQIGCTQREFDGKTFYSLNFKSEDDFNKWYKGMFSKDMDVSTNQGMLELADRIDTTMFLLDKHGGTLNFDPSQASIAPMTMYTDLSTTAQQMPGMDPMMNEQGDISTQFLRPGTDIYEETYEKEKQSRIRSYKYIRDANVSMEKAKQMQKENHKLTTKVKRFVDSWNEVRFEEISKFAGLFKKKKKNPKV